MVFKTARKPSYGKVCGELVRITVILLSLGANPVFAEKWVSVAMDGAKSLMYLDLVEGAVYIGLDCSPVLYFKQEPVARNKAERRISRFSVQKNRARGKQSALPDRSPTTIVIEDQAVKVIARTGFGTTHARGRVVPNTSAKRSSLLHCKS